MSRTYKDRKKKTPEPGTRLLKPAKQLSRRYLNFKRHGVCDEGDHCPDCGGLTDFQNGFLICGECGWVDAAEIQLLDELIA